MRYARENVALTVWVGKKLIFPVPVGVKVTEDVAGWSDSISALVGGICLTGIAGSIHVAALGVTLLNKN